VSIENRGDNVKDVDIQRLSEPYQEPREDHDRRFHSRLGADVPSAEKLVAEIFGDLDENALGVSWWTATPVQERALISDYLYRCAFAIETNLAEAKLHYLEFLDAREKHDKRMAASVTMRSDGKLVSKHPPSLSPIDDLINKQEAMHICGFFQSIGSTLDCLGALIIGVLGLDSRLRKSGISKAKDALAKLKPTGTIANQIQLDFRDFFEKVQLSCGVSGWLEFSDRNRNMFIHRGRRIFYNLRTPRPSLVVDKDGKHSIITSTSLHLVREPDKSDAEGMIKRNVALDEEAEKTLSGIFKSVRDLDEAICERLIEIWQKRRADPSLIEQPASQWEANIRLCNFNGYDSSATPLDYDEIHNSGVLLRRFVCCGAVDSKSAVWKGSAWDI
jgi:hypothetical protein